MKRIFQISFVLFFGGLLLQSCTKVDEPYSTYIIKPVVIDTTTRTVLLEDYTGHLCVNCAPAAKSANNLQELHKGQVYVIAVHAGTFAKPDLQHYVPYLIADYTCSTGNEWFSDFGIYQNPIGMVNRKPFSNKLLLQTSVWGNAVDSALKLPKAAIMTVKNSFDEQNKMLTTRVDTKFLVGFSVPVNLCVCILEDSIYGGQLNSIKPDSTPIIKNFLFMHILRGSVNGTYGEEIAVNPAVNAVFTKNYSFDFSPKPWVPGHCSVLAFILDANSKEVLHVGKAPVINN
jgi:hypothetical protein